MKNTTYQPLKRKWTGPIYNIGKFNSAEMGLSQKVNFDLSYDIGSGSEIMLFIKIDKPQVIYRFFRKVDALNNVAYIWQRFSCQI